MLISFVGPYTCPRPNCDQSFAQLNSLNFHISKHHSNNSEAMQNETKNLEKSKELLTSILSSSVLKSPEKEVSKTKQTSILTYFRNPYFNPAAPSPSTSDWSLMNWTLWNNVMSAAGFFHCMFDMPKRDELLWYYYWIENSIKIYRPFFQFWYVSCKNTTGQRFMNNKEYIFLQYHIPRFA